MALWKGDDVMKRTGIAFLAAAILLIGAVFANAAAVTTNIPIAPGWNLIGLPTVPLTPDPGSVFASYTDSGTGLTGMDAIDGNLYRWDPIAGGLVGYAEISPADFGNMLLGDGFWVFRNGTDTGTCSYQGVDVSGDHWISLPKAGWTLIGYPNNTPTSVDYSNLLVTNGIKTDSMTDAAYTDGWISDTGYFWNNSAGGLGTVGLADAFPDTTLLNTQQGYWIYTNVDNLALIVPGS